METYDFFTVTKVEKSVPLLVVSSAHYQILLKFIKTNLSFLNNPRKYPKTLNIITGELNRLGDVRSAQDWAKVILDWKTRVDYETQTNYKSMSPEDIELMNLSATKVAYTPSEKQLSVMLDHLEIVGDSPNIWATISVEMQALGSSKKPEEFWKLAFESWSNKINKKHKLGTVSLTDIERRCVEYVSNTTQEIVLEEASAAKILEVLAHHCRVCLTLYNNATYLYQELVDTNLTLADKVNMFCDIKAIEKDDNFPKYICKNCEKMVENAYTLKLLCEKSDTELRNLVKEYVKEEAAEFLDEETAEYLEDVDNDNEDTKNDSMVETQEEDGEGDMQYSVETEENGMEITYDELPAAENEEEIQTLTVEPPEPPTKRKEKTDNENKYHQCETCGIIFKHLSKLLLHKNTHLDVKPHMCMVCGKEFKKTVTLKIHMRSHTNERPYVCETCGKAFRTYGAMSNHLSVHSTYKMYKCSLCKYAASTKATLKIHDRTHSGVQPYVCEICHMKFSTASNMHKHVRNIHEKRKTNKCEMCDRAFFSRESVRKHMVTHTGVKPYICTQCSMTYSWYNGLQKHMRIQHPGIKVPTEKSFMALNSEAVGDGPEILN